MGCNCKANEKMERKIAERFNDNFKFPQKDVSLLRYIFETILLFLFMIISIPFFIVIAIFYKIFNKKLRIDIGFLMKEKIKINNE